MADSGTVAGSRFGIGVGAKEMKMNYADDVG